MNHRYNRSWPQALSPANSSTQQQQEQKQKKRNQKLSFFRFSFLSCVLLLSVCINSLSSFSSSLFWTVEALLPNNIIIKKKNNNVNNAKQIFETQATSTATAPSSSGVFETLFQSSVFSLLGGGGGGPNQKQKGKEEKEAAISSKKQKGQRLLEELDLKSNTIPKPFSVEPMNLPNVAFAALPAFFRFFTGAVAEGYQLDVVPRDTSQYTILPLFGGTKQVSETSKIENSIKDVTTMEPIIFYDREGDASCRLIREACSMLSLTVQIRPCPKDAKNQLQRMMATDSVRRKGVALPTLHDPNTGIEFRNTRNSSNNAATTAAVVQAILSYLFKTYGNGKVPANFNPNIAKFTASIAMASRFGRGSTYKSSNPPARPLTLWTYESSPFGKIVTEKLGELGIAYNAIYTPRGSPNRQRMMDMLSTYKYDDNDDNIPKRTFQVPFLVDPNTGVELWESAAICEYLEKQYSARTSVSYL